MRPAVALLVAAIATPPSVSAARAPAASASFTIGVNVVRTLRVEARPDSGAGGARVEARVGDRAVRPAVRQALAAGDPGTTVVTVWADGDPGVVRLAR